MFDLEIDVLKQQLAATVKPFYLRQRKHIISKADWEISISNEPGARIAERLESRAGRGVLPSVSRRRAIATGKRLRQVRDCRSAAGPVARAGLPPVDRFV